MSDSIIDEYLNGKDTRIATLETALRSLKKILSHNYRGLPISELEREEMLEIIKSTLGGDQNR